MKTFLERKLVIVLIAIAGLASLAFLVAGLRNMEFQPPEPLVFRLQPFEVGMTAMTTLESPWWYYVLFFVAILMLFSLVLAFLDPKLRKRLSRSLLRFLLTVAAITWLMQNYVKKGELSGLFKEKDIQTGDSGLGATNLGAGPVYTPPAISPWLTFGLSFLVALLVVVMVWAAYRRLTKKQPSSLGQIAEIARDAIDDLAEGRNWDDAIVQCYVRMSQVVTAHRGLFRQISTTPSEFAVRMEQAGLPGEAIRALTRLFEQVRYGQVASTADDRNMAVAALNAILRACGETA